MGQRSSLVALDRSRWRESRHLSQLDLALEAEVSARHIADILSYPGVPARWREPDLEAPHDLILPMELNLDGKIARMFSTVTTVATAHDVALQELHVEAFYPADAATELLLQTYQ